MDTATHILIGSTLAGLALIDPNLAGNEALIQATLVATLIGSNAPDFDTLSRIRGFKSYLTNHRAFTHSLTAMLIWPILITLPISFIFGVTENIFTLLLWSFIAVLTHVFMDWLNAYGVQCFRPLSQKWHHLDLLSIFDPILFALHLTGLLLWVFTNFEATLIFIVVYSLTAIYIILRAMQHHFILKLLKLRYPDEITIHLIPKLHWKQWQFVVELENFFMIGHINGTSVYVDSNFQKEEENPVIRATKNTDGVRTFLHFADRVHVSSKKVVEGYEVSWSDMRFNYQKKLSFGVDLLLDENLNIIDQKMGYRKKTLEPPYL
ncbi:MAG: hypothetical protein RLZZ267_1076 [Bacillota bacterium]|jgi:inner membrane protein